MILERVKIKRNEYQIENICVFCIIGLSIENGRISVDGMRNVAFKERFVCNSLENNKQNIKVRHVEC